MKASKTIQLYTGRNKNRKQRHLELSDRQLPMLRSECADIPRPCPYVSCRHNLYLEINEDTGSLILNFPTIPPEEMVHSCVLDIADEGGIQFHEIGAKLNLTRQRAQQIFHDAFGRLQQQVSGNDSQLSRSEIDKLTGDVNG